ncbi:MAG: NADH-quinone oxidoreductase subunit L [Gemmatimonadota bacterium]
MIEANSSVQSTVALWGSLVIGLPFIGFLLNGALALWKPASKTAVALIGPGVVIAACAAAVLGLFPAMAGGEDGQVVVTLWHWLPVGSSSIDAAIQIDHLSAVMVLIVTGVGSLIHLFAFGYMKEDEGVARFFAYLNLFISFMLVLVLSASMPVMFVGWEGVALCSYLLIGFWYTEKANADAGRKAFIMNRIGDFGFLVAMFLTWGAFGTLNFAEIVARAPSVLTYGGGVVTAITLFMFLGCAGKSAQIPLYTWLPDAMAGPTPVSALIHAATMVTAGVYLVARTNVLFAMAPVSSSVVAGVGALTALFAATIGLRQYDIKKVLAYSTVSQLGYMFVGVGTGAITAGVFHLATHAFFKALLFLGAGSVIHAMHHAYHSTHSHDDAQDMRNMGGLAKHMPVTATLMGIATLAIAGVPPFSGFFSKDEILAAAYAAGQTDPWFKLYWAMGLVAAALTAFYMARLMAMTFFGSSRTGTEEQQHLHEAPWIMTGPLVILGILSLAGGLLNLPAFVGGNAWLEHWLEPVTAPGQAARQAAGALPLALSHQTEITLIVLAVAVAILFLVVGWRVTLGRPIPTARRAPAESGFWKVLNQKYYVDEIYDAAIVRPVLFISRAFLWKKIDQGLIDDAGVNGAADLSRAIGWLGSRLQSGQVGLYVALFVVGALYVIAAAIRF